MRHLFFIAFLLIPQVLAAKPIQTEQQAIDYQVITGGLEHPWSLAFLPDGRFLVTERPGRLRMVEPDGRLVSEVIEGLPEIEASGQGGLLDVVLHPDFENNRWVYFS